MKVFFKSTIIVAFRLLTVKCSYISKNKPSSTCLTCSHLRSMIIVTAKQRKFFMFEICRRLLATIEVSKCQTCFMIFYLSYSGNTQKWLKVVLWKANFHNLFIWLQLIELFCHQQKLNWGGVKVTFALISITKRNILVVDAVK